MATFVVSYALICACTIAYTFFGVNVEDKSKLSQLDRFSRKSHLIGWVSWLIGEPFGKYLSPSFYGLLVVAVFSAGTESGLVRIYLIVEKYRPIHKNALNLVHRELQGAAREIALIRMGWGFVLLLLVIFAPNH